MSFNFPNSPAEGTIYSPAGGPSYVFMGGVWRDKSALPRALISDTPPSSPANGDLWWESDSGNLFLYYVDPDGPPGQWVQINTPSRLSTPTWELVHYEDFAGVTIRTKGGLEAFRDLRLVINANNPGATGGALILQLSSDNGATVISGTGDYFQQMIYGSGTTASASNRSSTRFELTDALLMTPGATQTGARIDMEISMFNRAAMKSSHFETGFRGGASVYYKNVAGAWCLPTIACNAVVLSCGQSMTGFWRIEGLRG